MTQITAKSGETESLKQEPLLEREVLKSWESSFLEDRGGCQRELSLFKLKERSKFMSLYSPSTGPLMPKATAIWLIENTTLTFQQIADFCEIHILEVQAIANEESSQGMMGASPIVMGQLTQQEIERCEKDPVEKLKIQTSMSEILLGAMGKRQDAARGSRYTPRARRGERPDAIAWLLKQCPSITDADVIKLVRTTKATIVAIRNRAHWNMTNIKPKSPVVLGFCTQDELDKIVKSFS